MIMCNSKICFKCGIKKEIDAYYVHKQMADGHLNKCIECTKKDSINVRNNNIDYYREYDKSRANNQNRVNGRLRYSQTKEGKDSARKAGDKWAISNVIKRAASHIVNNSIRDGRLIKQYQCEKCGKKEKRIHGHHDDYAYPLSVRWLCAKCHCDWHKENGAGING